MTLLLITLGLGVLSIALSTWRTHSSYGPSTWYWIGWSLGLLGHAYCVSIGDLDPLSHETFVRILQLHFGAALGFLLADFVCPVYRERGGELKKVEYTIPPLLWGLLLATTLLGLWALFDAVKLVGWDIASIRNQNLEQTYRQDPPLGFRIHNHVAIVVSPIVPLLAIVHIQAGAIRLRTILIVVLSTLPGMLATGGRGAILTVLPPYVVLTLAWSSGADGLVAFRRQLRRTILVGLLIVGTVTTGIDALRSGKATDRIASSENAVALDLIYPIAYYLAIPIAAMDAYSDYAVSFYKPQAPLSETFPFINRQLTRIGLVESGGDFYGDSRDYVATTKYSRFAMTHATIVPHLIADFGSDGVFPVSLLLCFVFECIALRTIRRGLVGAALTIWVSWDGAMNLASSNLFGMSGPILQILAAACILPFCRKIVAPTSEDNPQTIARLQAREKPC